MLTNLSLRETPLWDLNRAQHIVSLGVVLGNSRCPRQGEEKEKVQEDPLVNAQIHKYKLNKNDERISQGISDHGP